MPDGSISGLQKAAIFFIALGEEVAPEVLRFLDEGEIEKITGAIHELKTVSGEQIVSVLEEFYKYVSSDGMLFPHTKDYVQKVLVKTVGKERAQSVLRQLSSSSSPQKIAAMKMAVNIGPKALARLIGNEQPQVISLILSNMDAKLASTALMELPQALQTDVVSRMAQLGEVPPDVMEDVQGAFQRKVEESGSLSSRELDGMEMAARLLNNLDRESWNTIMDKIRERDAKLADEIKLRMFTFEDLVNLDDRTVQVILASINTQNLATALKGTSKELQEKVFKNLSKRAGDMLKEDMEALGPVKQREVFKVQQEILESVRKLEEEGKIEISSSEEDVLV